MKVNGYTKDAK